MMKKLLLILTLGLYSFANAASIQYVRNSVTNQQGKGVFRTSIFEPLIMPGNSQTFSFAYTFIGMTVTLDTAADASSVTAHGSVYDTLHGVSFSSPFSFTLAPNSEGSYPVYQFGGPSAYFSVPSPGNETVIHSIEWRLRLWSGYRSADSMLTGWRFDATRQNLTSTPEPSTYALISLGLVALLWRRASSVVC